MLNNKVVVVTGGAGLLGAAFVQGIVSVGGTAIIADTNEQAGRVLCSEINRKELAKKAYYISMDINDKSSILSLLSVISERHGRIDALVNNAYPRNRQYGQPLMQVEYINFCENININLGGYFLTSQQFVS
ncbi:MAG: SDR family NAD(P)-dependent oxidoreductase, partial [Legionellaceae bacterium]|nr:SDR family NAD(P)-dependent oxidoreductase [Legionellaceae bacterium]